MGDIVIHDSGIIGVGNSKGNISDYDIAYANKQALKQFAKDNGGDLNDLPDMTSSTSAMTEDEVSALVETLDGVPVDCFDEDYASENLFTGSGDHSGQMATIQVVAGLHNAGKTDAEIATALKNFQNLSSDQQQAYAAALTPDTTYYLKNSLYTTPTIVDATEGQKLIASMLVSNTPNAISEVSEYRSGNGDGNGSLTENDITMILALADPDTQSVLQDAGILTTDDIGVIDGVASLSQGGNGFSYTDAELADALNSMTSRYVPPPPNPEGHTVGYQEAYDDYSADQIDAAYNTGIRDINKATDITDLDADTMSASDIEDIADAIRDLPVDKLSDYQVQFFGSTDPDAAAGKVEALQLIASLDAAGKTPSEIQAAIQNYQSLTSDQQAAVLKALQPEQEVSTGFDVYGNTVIRGSSWSTADYDYKHSLATALVTGVAAEPTQASDGSGFSIYGVESLSYAHSMSSDDWQALTDAGLVTQDDADRIALIQELAFTYATPETITSTLNALADAGESSSDSLDAIKFLFEEMSDSDQTQALNVLSVDGDDRNALADFLVEAAQNPRDASNLIGVDDFETQAEMAVGYTPDEIEALVPDGLTQEQADRLVVASSLINAGVTNGDADDDTDNDLDTAMANYDGMSDYERSQALDIAKTRTLSGTDCFASMGTGHDYTQASLTYASVDPTTDEQYLSEYLVAGPDAEGVSVGDYVEARTEADAAAAAAAAKLEEAQNALANTEYDDASREEMAAYCSTIANDWDSIPSDEQDLIVNWMLAVRDPDNEYDDNGNIVDSETGELVAVAVTPETLKEYGFSDDEMLDVCSMMMIAMDGRSSSQEARIQDYADQVDYANDQMQTADDILALLKTREPGDGNSIDISQISVTDADGKEMSMLEWIQQEGIELDSGASATALTQDQVEDLEDAIGTYSDDKSTESDTVTLKLQKAEEDYKSTIEMWTNFIQLWGDLMSSVAEAFPTR